MDALILSFKGIICGVASSVASLRRTFVRLGSLPPRALQLMPLKLNLLLFVLYSGVSLSSCQMGYLLKSAKGQLGLLAKRETFETALQRGHLTEEQKKKLVVVQKAREFAEQRLHLVHTNNYTRYVKLDQDFVTYVVSASPKWELKHYHWKFPILGEVPYKGFFDEADAVAEETLLRTQDLDTYRRGVSAYSTLGWFEDPLLSSMLAYPDYDLVDLIIHETVHATLYIKNSADFNERMATFLGQKGAELYFHEFEGENSPTLQNVKNQNQDEKLFSQFISKEIKDLENWYKSSPEKNEEKRLQRLAEIQSRFKSDLLTQMKSKNYSRFSDIKLNNARLLVYKTYMQDLSDFDKLYELVGKDFQKFIERCKSLEKHPQPEQGLKEILSGKA